MALTDLTRISTAGIATGSTIDSPILRKDVNFRGNQVGVTSVLFDSSERELNLKDNVNLIFGDDGDLKLYHNGSHSYIDETGMGNLYIRNGTKNSIWCKTDGQVNLYFNDEKKFETAETGAIVTGILTATSFSGPIVGNTHNTSGLSTFYDLRVSNNLTVEGTTTTIDTNLINVDRIEVGADSSTTVAVSVAQTGSADIINLFDGNTEVLTVTDGGKVGIGITNPSQKLVVSGGSALDTASFNSNHANGVLINLQRSGVSKGFLGSGKNIADSTGGVDDIGLRSNANLIFTSGGGTERLRIISTGSVGIGTTNPLRKLDVVGNSILVRPTDTTTLHSSGNASAVNNSIIIRMPYGENAASTANAGARFGIQFTGANNTTDVPSLNFGDDPTKSASIYGVSEDNLGYNRKVGMVFYTSNFDIAQRERLRIASDGKVAMGLTSTSGGTCNPDGNALLIRAASTFGTKNGHIMLTGDSATVGQGPQIVFSESGSGANWAGAYIGHVRQGGGSVGDLVFATRQVVGDADTVPVEALRITSVGDVGINVTPTSTDMAGVKPRLHVLGISTSGQFNTVARFQSGTDNNDSGAAVVINHTNDRGLVIQGGRGGDADGVHHANSGLGRFSIINNSGTFHKFMEAWGQNGGNIENISLFTGNEVEALRIHSGGLIEAKTSYSDTYASTTGITPHIRVRNQQGADDIYGGIQLRADRNNGAAAIFNIACLNSSTNYASTLVFQSRRTDGNFSEKVRITSDNVPTLLIGQTTAHDDANGWTLRGDIHSSSCKFTSTDVRTMMDYSSYYSTGSQESKVSIHSTGMINSRYGTSLVLYSCERRTKKNIVDLDKTKAWNTLRDTPMYSWNYKKEAEGTKKHYGPIVDECPEDIIIPGLEEDEEGIINTVDSDKLQFRAYTALSEALKRIETLEAKVSALEGS